MPLLKRQDSENPPLLKLISSLDPPTYFLTFRRAAGRRHACSELQAQRKLNQSRVHRRRTDHAELRVIHQQPATTDLGWRADWIGELRMIEQIEKFRSELQVFVLANLGHLGDREVRIELSRPTPSIWKLFFSGSAPFTLMFC